MTTTFPSKIDRWLAILVLGAMLVEAGAGISIIISQPQWWIGLLMISLALFILWTFQSTYYVVGDGELLIRSGPFRWRVPLVEIQEIYPTRNPLSSPALSLDRLAVRYLRNGKRRMIMISPANKAEFFMAVAAATPNLVIEGERLKREMRSE